MQHQKQDHLPDFKNLSVESLKAYLEEYKTKTTATLDKIVAVQEPRTYDNTVWPIIVNDTLLEGKTHLFHIASSFHPDQTVRDCANECEKEANEFSIESSMRRDTYQAFLAYEQDGFIKEKEALSGEKRRYFEHQMRDFKRMGLALNDADFERCKVLKKELSKLRTDFQKNVNEEKTSFDFSRTELEGMPEDWFVDEKKVGEGVYRVTLKYPDYNPASEFVKNDEVRHKLWYAYNTRCRDVNIPIFEKAIRIRYQIAKLLGYENHADYKTETKIIKNGDNAYTFLQSLNERFTPGYNNDLHELLEFAKSYAPNPLQKEVLDPWDYRYYVRAYKEVKNQVDMEEVKKYFPLEKVTQGLFDIYQNLLGLLFQEVHTDNKWHEKSRIYSVNDKETNELLGYFVLDLYPREGKYGHAAVFQIQAPCNMMSIDGSGYRPAVIAMACNFPETGCITFDDVVTFFHEFGHMMHQICSRPEIHCFEGFGVEWDFVEAPSQMLEFWCYEEESLKIMSAHKETGEPVSKEMIEKLREIELTLVGYQYKRQLMFGLYDLFIHRMKLEDDVSFDSTEIWYHIQKEVLGFDAKEHVAFQASFGHLMGGYDAGYYGYLRAETYAVNMFYKWFKHGHVLDPHAGMRYRKKLLEPGSTQDSLDLLRDFLGEEPDDTYFLIDKRLIEPEVLE